MTEDQKSDYHSHTDSQGRTQGELGSKTPPLSLILIYFTKTLLPAQRKLIVFAYTFVCQFVDLMPISRNEFACKFQGTL